MTDFDDMERSLTALRKRQLLRRRRTVDSPVGREIDVDGRRLLNFCSNDYLGLAADQRVRDAFKQGVDRWGAGAGASHLVSGHTTAHAALEADVAARTRRDRALVFSSGYAANVGVIDALVGSNDVIFQDRLNHASLLDGGWLSGARFEWYAHRSPEDLALRMAACADDPGRRLVVTDGTFSMDGDLCPLDELVRIARRHGAWLMVDDAHGIGVHGADGCGVVDPGRYDSGDVPVLVGTFGKAFGTAGAFVAGSDALIETLIQRARHYVYTTAMPPALAVATRASLAISDQEPWRRERLAALVTRFRAGAAELGLQLLPSATPIQPVVVGSASRVMTLGAALERRGVLVGTIRPPTVPAGTARLRITLTAAHLPADVDRLVTALAEAPSESAGESAGESANA